MSNSNTLVGAIYWLICVIIPIFAFIDAFGRSPEAFERAGQSRGNWLAAIAITGFCCGIIGTGLSLYYLLAVRKKLA